MASFEKHKIKERTTRGRRAAIAHGKIAPSMRLPTGQAWDAAARRVVIDGPGSASGLMERRDPERDMGVAVRDIGGVHALRTATPY